MTAKYYVTLTDYGATQVAQAHDVASITLAQMVIGDANGIPYDPIDQKSRTSLVNQRASVPVQAVTIEGAVTTVTATVAANIGGFNLHEIGLKDNTGQLIYIGNYHGAYKPVIAEGAGGELTIVIDITAESGKETLIEIDPNVVTANKSWVIENFASILNLNEVDERLSAAIVTLASALNPFLVKTGFMMIWTTPICPSGFLECNGDIYPISSYPDLFAIIGNTFGGDGVTTFAVPNMIDNFARGWDHIRDFGSFQNATSVFMGDPSVTAGRIANLYNTTDDNQQTMVNALNGEATTIDSTNLVVLSSAAEIQDPVTPVQATMSVRPRNLALMFVIKT